MDAGNLSIVIPAKNESAGLTSFLPKLREIFPDSEIIVVNDGSTDNTEEVCLANGVAVHSHPYSKGNGAAIKSGARCATKDTILFMDGDGQHIPTDGMALVEKLCEGYDLVVGARQTMKDQANVFRGLGNRLYNKLASFMVGHKVDDLTSGLRAVNREKFLQFLSLLPNGFSYPTTSTMAFFRSGYTVCFVPITVRQRLGTSHLNVMKDGVRFLLIIFKIATLYSPLKLFVPLSLLMFALGMIRYAYTFVVDGTFTNMSATLFVSSLLIFLIGLVSEQVATLTYLKASEFKTND